TDIKCIVIGAAFAASIFCSNAAESDSVSTAKKDLSGYIPKIHGVMRTRFEQLTSDSKEGRFQIANARLNVSGNVTDFASYFFQVDFCDKGVIKILDAFTTLKSKTGWKIMAGQMRVPFSVDASKVIEDYLFTNHSFVGTYVGSFRGVGVKFGWNANFARLYVEGGVFNSPVMTNHEVWQKDYVYAVKSRYSFDNCFIEGAFESRCPDGIRINMWDAAFSWSAGRWYTEAEYAYKHYTNSAASACNAYNFMVDYRIPIKTEWFNQLSFQGRFDGATDHSSGTRINDVLVVNNPSRKRLSGGVTISHLGKRAGIDLRIDYEQYFYPENHIISVGDGNRISAELIVWF
ncbi:MAG: OprO/OprP family phosphate-selective porin, partial [Muribaculaceae bacterium]|nr:OprO/OprP family phosphate-selective porin [Muribaculaceae bacterium]